MTAIDPRVLAALAGSHIARYAAAHEERFARARAMLLSMGVQSSTYRGGLLVSETGYRELKRLATYPNEVFPRVDRFADIPIYTAPDWTFDMHRIAILRIRIAVVDSWARPLVRRIARWFR